MHYGFCFIAFRMVFIPCYKALYMLLQSTTCMENIYGFFYSFGYKLNADIASPSFWVGWSIISFDSTNKLIDGPVVIFIHFVINGLMHGFYTRYIFFSGSKMHHEYFYLQVYLLHDPCMMRRDSNLGSVSKPRPFPRHLTQQTRSHHDLSI